ncbi:hypothetical protein TSOC_011431 [Tetrabaena socialis]|uniref:Uncharacterized protein n=1 Tax=Tetrabaena socialis TaxID=47790 RepID=A0A2J7ZQP1_9CHLO|nr:hypothetical protein TSOC_011431 [Tetrabaena socialis]|eukprot:PNH02579.1 hypothetical protein TSOC_011431 [Tetrabaena socialis]
MDDPWSWYWGACACCFRSLATLEMQSWTRLAGDLPTVRAALLYGGSGLTPRRLEHVFVACASVAGVYQADGSTGLHDLPMPTDGGGGGGGGSVQQQRQYELVLPRGRAGGAGPTTGGRYGAASKGLETLRRSLPAGQQGVMQGSTGWTLLRSDSEGAAQVQSGATVNSVLIGIYRFWRSQAPMDKPHAPVDDRMLPSIVAASDQRAAVGTWATALFCTILASNLLGLVPTNEAPTAGLGFATGLGVSVWATATTLGLYKLGFNFPGHFIPGPKRSDAGSKRTIALARSSMYFPPDHPQAPSVAIVGSRRRRFPPRAGAPPSVQQPTLRATLPSRCGT